MEIRKTISSIFILPSLDVSKNDLAANGFVNAYIGDVNHEYQYEDCIYILFKPENLYRIKTFILREKERTADLVDDYDYEGGYVVMVYRLNSEFKSDYALIKEGKYSKTSSLFQSKFPKVVKIMKNGLHKDEISIQYRVFNKTSDLVKFWEDKLGISFPEGQEVWDGFDYEKETLNIQKIKEYARENNS